MRVKKDRIFVIVMGLVLVNLTFSFAGYLSAMWIAKGSITYWTVLLANLLAIIGVLMLLRTYRKGRRIEKKEQGKEAGTIED